MALRTADDDPINRAVAMKLTLPPIKEATRQDKASSAWVGGRSIGWKILETNKAMEHPTTEAKLAKPKGKAMRRMNVNGVAVYFTGSFAV